MSRLTFGESIKEARRVRRISQKDLAEKCLMSVEDIRKVEQDLLMPPYESFGILAKTLRLSVEYLERTAESGEFLSVLPSNRNQRRRWGAA